MREIDNIWYAARLCKLEEIGFTIKYDASDNNFEEGPFDYKSTEIRFIDDSEISTDIFLKQNDSIVDDNKVKYFLDDYEQNTFYKIINKINHKELTRINNIILDYDKKSYSKCKRIIENQNHSIDDLDVRSKTSHAIKMNKSIRSRSFDTKHETIISTDVLPFDRCVQCQKWTSWRCKRCNSAFYCSKSCQREHWSMHKSLCSVQIQPFMPYYCVPATDQVAVVSDQADHLSQAAVEMFPAAVLMEEDAPSALTEASSTYDSSQWGWESTCCEMRSSEPITWSPLNTASDSANPFEDCTANSTSVALLMEFLQVDAAVARGALQQTGQDFELALDMLLNGVEDLENDRLDLPALLS